MDTFPLRYYLRIHSAARTWRQLPPSVKALFAGMDRSVLLADFFVADVKHSKNQFVITQTVAGQQSHQLADVIGLLYPEIAILIRYRGSDTQHQESSSIWKKNIDGVGFRIGVPDK